MSTTERDYLTAAELGRLARRMREAAGESQSEAAGRLGVSQAIVSRAERGQATYVKAARRLVETYSGRSVDPEPRYLVS